MRFIRYFFICLLVLFACMQFRAQEQTRGFGTVTPPAAATKSGRTVALVVGVSDYPFVTPLNYAAEDALLMYDFLQSSAGGNVSPADIRLLVNEEATLQNVWGRGLSWIENTVKPAQGDRVIIYLAGHGDAISSDESFFLCYNANPAGDKNNYHVSGALNVSILKNRIAKFSAAGAEVVLIMDACRSGDLPGVRTGITNPFESVVERKAGETLMLSAGANQLAVEDRRWGRGHGIFTWYLVQGLSGKADENADGTVDFFELEQYTKTKVRKETQAMGRIQVPQFTASPAGMGWQGKADKNFLSKLETESLSSVNVGESIALARSTAESSWFTDSTLYAGFNELKKLVRADKYLGEGSAEPIYTQLAAQFSADQLEPVRVYYMSALAGAGFEAVTQDLFLDIGYKATPSFYAKRYNYMRKAKALQLCPNEIHQLEDYFLLLEAIHLNYISNREIIYSQGMVDSLSKLRSSIGKCAAYYTWMFKLGVDPMSSQQVTRGSSEHNRLFYILKDSCVKLAPDWPRVKMLKLVFSSPDEINEAYGEEILKMISENPTNADFRFMLFNYYTKHRPIDVPNWIESLVTWSKMYPSGYGLSLLCAQLYALEHPGFNGDIVHWLNAEALRNHYHYKPNGELISNSTDIFKLLVNKPEVEDFVDSNWGFAIDCFLRYNTGKGRLPQQADLLVKATARWVESNWRSNNQTIYSLKRATSLEMNKQEESPSSQLFSRLEVQCAKDAEGFFSDTSANLIANNIIGCIGIVDLDKFKNEQVRLLEKYNYLGFNDEFVVFRASNLISNYEDVSVSFADSLLQLCHRKPDMKNFQLYVNLLDSCKWQTRQSELFTDSIFQHNKSVFLKEQKGKLLYCLIESRYHCQHSDTIQLKGMLQRCLNEGDTALFISVLMKLEPRWQHMVAEDMLSDESIAIGFADLVDLGMLDRAERMYKGFSREASGYLGSDEERHNEVRKQFAAMKLFNLKRDFAQSSIIMEELIYSVTGIDEFSVDPMPFRELLGPYDAFVQSKEYKAMMARVYTAAGN